MDLVVGQSSFEPDRVRPSVEAKLPVLGMPAAAGSRGL
jgi:hypothetical protein